ncbi:MAG: SMC-Scp complex subunit ScpB [Eubacterium sp.]|nr:SMC-Scp complex subunit ScpB [Eubacterium sp.]
MKFNEYLCIIESILFAVGDPITLDKIAEASGIEKETVVKLIDQLERRYNVQESALRIIRLDNAFQIATREEYAPYIKKALENKRQAKLSPAALEVLAVAAYNQPVTKAFIEQVRGADSSGVVNTLVERGLLCEAGRLDLPGRPLTYKTTDTFLRCFKLESLKQLPPLPSEDGQLDLSQLAEAAEAEESMDAVQEETAAETE